MQRQIFLIFGIVIVLFAEVVWADDVKQNVSKVFLTEESLYSIHVKEDFTYVSIKHDGKSTRIPFDRTTKYINWYTPINIFEDSMFYILLNNHPRRGISCKFNRVPLDTLRNHTTALDKKQLTQMHLFKYYIYGIRPISSAIWYAEENEEGFSRSGYDNFGKKIPAKNIKYPVYFDFTVLDENHFRLFILSRSPNPRTYEEIELSVWDYDGQTWQPTEKYRVDFLEPFLAFRSEDKDYLILESGTILLAAKSLQKVGQTPDVGPEQQFIVDKDNNRVLVSPKSAGKARLLENAIQVLPLK